MERSLYHPLKFDGMTAVPGNIFLAPMSGFTDAAFRETAALWGAELCYTEMVSCEALVRNNEKTKKLLKKGDGEKIYAVQIFVSNAGTAVKSLPYIEKYRPAVIDINCGCPVPKVLKSGCGAALGREPEKIGEIIKALKNETDIPITIKIRSGWDKNSLNFLETGEIAEKAGVNAVTLHPRTRNQHYEGNADWKLIRELKKNLSVPVIGSGDLFSPEAVREMAETTECDGVMIARGAVGCPEIFRYARELFETGAYSRIGPEERLKTAIAHFSRSVKYIGEELACKEMKKHLCAYTKGLKGSAEIRKRIVCSEKPEEYLKILGNLLSEGAQDPGI